MCYSAQIEEAYRAYLRATGAEMDLPQFVDIYGQRAAGRNIRIPRGFDRNFDAPQSPHEVEVKRLIDAWRVATVRELEQEIFAQSKRRADAERKLQTRDTKAARESQRIATSKIDKALQRLTLLKTNQPHPEDGRVFPMYHVPIVINEGGRTLLRLARYHCRQAGATASVDRQFPGLYNARRDNLEKFWRGQFGQHHAVMLAHSFYENVERDGHNVVLHFQPQPAGLMYVACLYSRWTDPEQGQLLSFAAITDEPPAEVRAAGHDRMIVNLRAENVARWLTPAGRSVDELQGMLSDRQQPYYEHQVLAA